MSRCPSTVSTPCCNAVDAQHRRHTASVLALAVSGAAGGCTDEAVRCRAFGGWCCTASAAMQRRWSLCLLLLRSRTLCMPSSAAQQSAPMAAGFPWLAPTCSSSASPWHIELVEPAFSSDLFVVPAQPLLNSSCSQSWTLESLWALYVPQTHHLSYARGSRQRLPPLRLR